MTVWRICLSKYVDSALSGSGAEQYGGRFNSPGRPVVYTSGSLSLALLEILVQANATERMSDQVCIPVHVDESMIENYSAEDLPEGWNSVPYTHLSQRIGDQWLTAQRSPVLRVPSVVVPLEYNYLINPRHPGGKAISVRPSFPVPFDSRLRNG